MVFFFPTTSFKTVVYELKVLGNILNRSFYLEIDKGQEVEKVCGRRTGLTVVWEGPSLHLRYHSSRRTSLATGFKAQYHILNKSLTEGQFNFITKSLRKTFEKHQIVRETFYGTFCLILSLVQNQLDFTRIFCHD